MSVVLNSLTYRFAGSVMTTKYVKILLHFSMFLTQCQKLCLATVIKDLLMRCNLPLELCRGQAYDGAANMQGRQTGVAARFLNENNAPVHCFAHSLNLCLQAAGRILVCLRDAIETVREINNLIRFSPKRLHLMFTS